MRLFLFLILCGLQTLLFAQPVPFEKDGKWGYREGERIILDAQYEQAQHFHEGRAVIQKKGKWALVDPDGKRLTGFRYDFPFNDFRNGMALVSRKGKYGFVNRSGNEKIKAKLERAFPFIGSAALAMLEGKYGYLDSNAVWVVTPRYDEADPLFREGTARVRLGKRWGCIDSSGKVVQPIIFDSLGENLHYGMRKAVKGDSIGWADNRSGRAMSDLELTIPELNDSSDVPSLKIEILANRACLAASEYGEEQVMARVRKEGLFTDAPPSYPHVVKISSWENHCAWMVRLTILGDTREGDCQYTNGCTVVLTRQLWFDALDATLLHKEEDRKLYPNYE